MNIFQKIGFVFGRKGSLTGWPSVQAAMRFLFDDEDATLSMNETFRKSTWVYSAINAISRNISRVPFKIMNGTQEVTSGPAFQLFRKPNQFDSMSQFWEKNAIFKHLTGDAFIYIIQENGIPLEFVFLNKEFIKPELENGTLKSWKYRRGSIQLDIPVEEMIHMHFSNPYDQIMGLSPLTAAMLTLEIDNDATLSNRYILKNGSGPGGVIKFPNNLSDDQFKRIKSEWDRTHKGVKNQGKVAILDNGGDFLPTQMNQNDMKYLEQKKWTRDEICGGIFGVPPIEVGVYEQSNYANSYQQSHDFWTKKLIPELKYYEDCMKAFFFDRYFPGLEGKFDLTVIPELQENINLKVDTAVKLFNMGFTANEVNDSLKLGFKPQPWRDYWWVPFSLAPANAEAAAQPAADQQPAPVTEPAKMMANLEAAHGKLVKLLDGNRKHFMVWKRFINSITDIMNPFASKISRFMFELRKEILNVYDARKGVEKAASDLFNLGAAKKKIIEIGKPFLKEAMEKAGTAALHDLDLSAVFNVAQPAALNALNGRTLELKGIVDTVSERVKEIVAQGMKDGASTSDIVQTLKDYMTISANRAAMIARTEIVGAANEGRSLAFKENDIERHEWVNSMDADVRESHAINEIVKVGEPFSNGLLYPGDKNGPADEVINCRCTTVGVV